MQIHRERKQTITIELGLCEAKYLSDEIKYCGAMTGAQYHGGILEQVQRRLERHVAEAKKDNPRV